MRQFITLLFLLLTIPTHLLANNNLPITDGLDNSDFRRIYQAALEILEKELKDDDYAKLYLAIAYLRAQDIDSCYFDNATDLGELIHMNIAHRHHYDGGLFIPNPEVEFYVTIDEKWRNENSFESWDCFHEKPYELEKCSKIVRFNEKDADGLHNLGVRYYDKHEYNHAYDYFIKAAEKGFVPSQLMIGLMYSRGFYVTKNYKEAKKWFDKVVENTKSSKDERSITYNENAQYALKLINSHYDENVKEETNKGQQATPQPKNQLEGDDIISSSEDSDFKSYIEGNVLFQRSLKADGLQIPKNAYTIRDAFFWATKEILPYCTQCMNYKYDCIYERANYMIALVLTMITLKETGITGSNMKPKDYILEIEITDNLLNQIRYYGDDDTQINLLNKNILSLANKFYLLPKDWSIKEKNRLTVEQLEKAYNLLKELAEKKNEKARIILDLAYYCDNLPRNYWHSKQYYPTMKHTLDTVDFSCIEADSLVQSREIFCAASNEKACALNLHKDYLAADPKKAAAWLTIAKERS